MITQQAVDQESVTRPYMIDAEFKYEKPLQ